MAISILDTFIESGATDETSPGSFTVSAGSNRLLVYIQIYEGNTDTISQVAYGGQNMTEDVRASTAAGGDMDVRIWTLDDAGIVAASGTSFVVTGTTSDTYRAYVGSLEGVEQGGTRVVDTTARIDSSQIGIAVDTDVVEDGFVVGGGGNGGSVDAHAWTGITERIETSNASMMWSLAYDLPSSDGTISTSLSIGTGTGARAYALLSLRPADVIVDLSGTASAVSGSSANLEIGKDLSGTAAAVSGSSAAIQLGFSLSGTSSSVSGSQANEFVTRAGRATGAAVSGGAANSLLLKLATTTAPAVSGGSANASEFTGARATGASVSGGRANADPPVPIVPPTPLQDSFLQAQRPVILVDLFLDSGELNIWTRPFPGEFAQKTYQPLAGITSGLTFRNSLETNAIEASLQLSGQSDEILTIALQEQFQNRNAQVFLGNLGNDMEIEAVSIVLTGTIVNMVISDTGEDSTISVVIESVFRTINQSDIRRLSSGDQKLRFPDDTFFDFVETVESNTPRFGD